MEDVPIRKKTKIKKRNLYLFFVFMENSREKFKQAFPDTHSLIVVLHPQSIAHALEGAEIAIENDAHGVAVVTHSIDPMTGFDCIEKIKEKYPYHIAILNILDWRPETIFQVLG